MSEHERLMWKRDRDEARRERDQARRELDRLTRERGEAYAEIERLRQYEPPVSFQGTEIVWDDLREAREALKVAHHALTCVHGLWATDDLEVREKDVDLFEIDMLKALAAIEKALGGERDETS